MNYKKKIEIGNIVKVFDDSHNYRLARIVYLDKQNEEAVVTFLDDLFMDEETATVSLLNVEKYLGKLVKE